MPIANLALMLLIGIVLGGVAAVVLRGRGPMFAVNILLGSIGAALGALLPALLGQTLRIDTASPDYLLRALMGAFLLVLLAGLFRPAGPRRLND